MDGSIQNPTSDPGSRASSSGSHCKHTCNYLGISSLPVIKENDFGSLLSHSFTHKELCSPSRFAGLCGLNIHTTCWQEAALPRGEESLTLVLGSCFCASLVCKQQATLTVMFLAVLEPQGKDLCWVPVAHCWPSSAVW